MKIEFIDTKKWGIQKKSFETSLKRLKKHIPTVEGVLNVVFVDDVYIQELNRTYRKKDRPTDVLSFSYLDSPDFEQTHQIGEIFISVLTAQKQAKEFGNTLDKEITKLLVHGFLHIFGHEHDSDEGYERMNRIEDEIFY